MPFRCHRRVALLLAITAWAITPWLGETVAGAQATAIAKGALDLARTLAAPQEPAPAKPAAAATLQARCSDVLLEVAGALAAAYHEKTPAVTVNIAGGGSGAAFNGLASGAAQLAFTTRALRKDELDGIRAKGFEPIEQVVGHDAFAIVVHPDNPIASLTMAQLAKMWTDKGAVERWSQLDVKLANVTDDQIALVGPQKNSGSGVFFRELVAGRGDLRLGVYEINGSKELVALVGKTPTAIGYCQFAYATDQPVRTVPLAVENKGKTTLLMPADDGYPLRRTCYLYFRDEANGTAKAFAAWLRSPAAAAALRAYYLQPPKSGR